MRDDLKESPFVFFFEYEASNEDYQCCELPQCSQDNTPPL
jgi:hypothetical protein